jgi:hypothetical protein
MVETDRSERGDPDKVFLPSRCSRRCVHDVGILKVVLMPHEVSFKRRSFSVTSYISKLARAPKVLTAAHSLVSIMLTHPPLPGV